MYFLQVEKTSTKSGHFFILIRAIGMFTAEEKKIKAYKSDWLSKGIVISCRQKHLLFKTYKQNPTIENEATYKTYKNKLTHCHEFWEFICSSLKVRLEVLCIFFW